MQRVVWSLLVLPVIIWASVSLRAWLLGQVPPDMRFQDSLMLGSYLALFTYVAVGFITLPLLLLCLWRKWVTIWHAMVVGAVTGALPLSLPAFAQLFDGRLHLHFRVQQLAVAASSEFVVIGIIGGALFWLLAVWRNPTLGRGEAGQQERQAQSAA